MRSKRDWSSDVCSSDLFEVFARFAGDLRGNPRRGEGGQGGFHLHDGPSPERRQGAAAAGRVARHPRRRSEERRVGKEWRCGGGRGGWRKKGSVGRWGVT